MARATATALLMLGAIWTAQAEEPEGPDVEFLEYLGSWQESDEEWLLAKDWEEDERRAAAEQADGAPAREREAPETEVEDNDR